MSKNPTKIELRPAGDSHVADVTVKVWGGESTMTIDAETLAKLESEANKAMSALKKRSLEALAKTRVPAPMPSEFPIGCAVVVVAPGRLLGKIGVVKSHASGRLTCRVSCSDAWFNTSEVEFYNQFTPGQKVTIADVCPSMDAGSTGVVVSRYPNNGGGCAINLGGFRTVAIHCKWLRTPAVEPAKVYNPAKIEVRYHETFASTWPELCYYSTPLTVAAPVVEVARKFRVGDRVFNARAQRGGLRINAVPVGVLVELNDNNRTIWACHTDHLEFETDLKFGDKVRVRPFADKGESVVKGGLFARFDAGNGASVVFDDGKVIWFNRCDVVGVI